MKNSRIHAFAKNVYLLAYPYYHLFFKSPPPCSQKKKGNRGDGLDPRLFGRGGLVADTVKAFLE